MHNIKKSTISDTLQDDTNILSNSRSFQPSFRISEFMEIVNSMKTYFEVFADVSVDG